VQYFRITNRGMELVVRDKAIGSREWESVRLLQLCTPEKCNKPHDLAIIAVYFSAAVAGINKLWLSFRH
jgi:hypothetical protein